MSFQEFSLPDVGEGLTEAEIITWKVHPGQQIALNQPIVEIETAKSLVELPSPFEGRVEQLMVAEGQTVEVGTPIIRVHTDAQSQSPHESASPSGEQEQVTPASSEVSSGSLVGSGPAPESRKRKIRRARGQAASTTAPPERQTRPALPPEPPVPAPVTAASVPPASAPVAVRVLAKPPVRKIAKDFGVDLGTVSATGARGEVTRIDLERHLRQGPPTDGGLAPDSGIGAPGSAAAPASPVSSRHIASAAQLPVGNDFWVADSNSQDRDFLAPVRGVRKATAKSMVASAFSAPHVSIFVDVDASRTMEFVKRLKESRDFEGIKVSPLLILAKAVIWATARNPQVNATWGDEDITVHRYMNLGIAAATPRGLLVPNIKDAQKLSLKELAVALNTLAQTARNGRSTPADMQGGTMTITNIGALGIDTGTPIINPGEVAIIAFGTIKQKPWVLGGEVLPRWVTTLGGSFDHRVVDGDLSARFMADVASILEEPAMLLD